MSKELDTKMQDHSATRYWGGDDFCIQITSHDFDRDRGNFPYLQFNRKESAALVATLCEYLAEKPTK